ncbi:MAG: hypothetical protein K0B02_00455 [DPANN group archaeon]|nr:hypothetical protein [DPANN group archaeon]
MDVENDKVLSQISKVSGIKIDEILKKVLETESEFSGLVSRIGAIHLVGRELGCDLIKPMDLSTNISDIFDGMSSLNFSAKVFELYPVKVINTARFNGRLQTIKVGDISGVIELTLWNDDIDKLEGVVVGDIVDIKKAYSKENYMGVLTVNLGRSGVLKKTTNKKIIEQNSLLSSVVSHSFSSLKGTLSNFSENDIVNIKAIILEINKKPQVYDMCPECRKKLVGDSCDVHGMIVPEKQVIISCVVDDGYNVIDTTFFGTDAEFIIGQDVLTLESKLSQGYDTFISSLDIIGKEFVIDGTIKNNSFTGTLELLVKGVDELNIENEIKKLL